MPGAGHRPPLFASWPGAAALPLTLVFNNFPAHAWQNIEGVPHIFLLEYNINASQHTTFMLVHPPIRQLPRSSNIDKDLPIRLAQRFMCSTLEYSAADLWSPGDATQTDLGQSFDALHHRKYSQACKVLCWSFSRLCSCSSSRWLGIVSPTASAEHFCPSDTS